MLAQGPRTRAFEEAFARAVGVRHAIATSSGTTALHLALLAAGVHAGDEVITTAFTFIASVNAILYVGGTPVFADIDPRTFTLDPDAVERAITPRTKAILVVHLYGRACAMDRLCELARRRGLVLVEDCAQAIGARFAGRSVGSFGLGAFSLYATKNVTSGEGGMLTTDDDATAHSWRLLRQHGSEIRNQHELLGYNYRMTDLHAAIGLVQLSRLDELTAARQANAHYFGAHLQGVVVPHIDAEHVVHQYTVRVPHAERRDAMIEQLAEAGVEAGVFYPVPAYRQPHLRVRGFGAERLPHTECAAREVLCLPVHPLLSAYEREVIVRAVATASRSSSGAGAPSDRDTSSRDR